jgi:AcrR family transcriptional regulator
VKDKTGRILEATLRLVAERGLYDTPMSLVAKEADVAAGTIYHYFENKDALIFTLFRQCKEQLAESLKASYKPAAGYQENFAHLWRGMFGFYIKNPLVLRFLEQFENTPLFDAPTRESSKQYYQEVIDFMQSGIDQGILRDMEIDLMVQLIHGTIVSVAKAHLAGFITMDQAKLFRCIEVSWNGLKR